MPTTIRPAVEQDVDDLVAMGREMHAESPRFQTMGFSEDKVRRLFTTLQGTLLAKPGCMFVADRDGSLIGMAVAVIGHQWFNDAPFVTDLAVFIKPAHRPSRSFPRLVQAIETWAFDQGVPEVILGISTGVHAEQTAAMYERLGYLPHGISMEKKHV